MLTPTSPRVGWKIFDRDKRLNLGNKKADRIFEKPAEVSNASSPQREQIFDAIANAFFVIEGDVVRGRPSRPPRLVPTSPCESASPAPPDPASTAPNSAAA